MPTGFGGVNFLRSGDNPVSFHLHFLEISDNPATIFFYFMEISDNLVTKELLIFDQTI